MTDHLDRTSHFTNKEFKALKRNGDGDIIELSTAFIWLTEDQIDQLSEDDWSRLDLYEEDARCLMADALVEFS